MSKYIVTTFSTTPKLKELVEQWAQENERSVSYIIRKAIEREAQRRSEARQRPEGQPTKK